MNEVQWFYIRRIGQLLAKYVMFQMTVFLNEGVRVSTAVALEKDAKQLLFDKWN